LKTRCSNREKSTDSKSATPIHARCGHEGRQRRASERTAKVNSRDRRLPSAAPSTLYAGFVYFCISYTLYVGYLPTGPCDAATNTACVRGSVRPEDCRQEKEPYLSATFVSARSPPAQSATLGIMGHAFFRAITISAATGGSQQLFKFCRSPTGNAKIRSPGAGRHHPHKPRAGAVRGCSSRLPPRTE
jgi:hypothetical protein